MPTILARHRVADYEKWRPIYDADRPRRREAGLEDVAVYRDADDPDVLLLMWNAEDTAGLFDMLDSPALADKMREAGVVSPPEVWIAEAADEAGP